MKKQEKRPETMPTTRLDRRDFTQTFALLLALFTFIPRVKASADPAEVTAERLASLLEAPETPPVVRDLIREAGGSIDMAAAQAIVPNCAACRGGD